MKILEGWGAQAQALLWRWAGNFLWSCLCLIELLVSTCLHIGFGTFVIHSALAKDVLALLPNLLSPFYPSSPPNFSSRSNSDNGSRPSSPVSLPVSPSFTSHSYLMSCSVLFSSSSTYPFRLAAWLRESASAWSSLSWPSSPLASSRSASINNNPGGIDSAAASSSSSPSSSTSSSNNRGSSTATTSRGTSLLQLDVPTAGKRARKSLRNGRPDAADSGGSPQEEASESTQASEPSSSIPIVLLHGIFGFGHGRLGKLSYFGGVEEQHKGVFVPDLGSLTSLHDRARRLFYYLKGGTVDYGEEHSTAAGHSRHGISLPGQHPVWDENNPVHLVGHSAGVQVARLLQQMLADQEFEGYDTNADWVTSITSLSGALNGTTRVYIDGLLPEDGSTMTPVSLLQVLRFGVLVYEWMDLPFMNEYYNFGFGHFEMAWHKTGMKGLWESLVTGVKGPFSTGDWILPDLSIQHSMRLNTDKIRTHPNTYYFSYATVATQQHTIMGQRTVLPAGFSTVHPLFTLRCLQMSLWKFPAAKAQLPYKGFRDEEWQHNDGALNVVSMLYPLTPTDRVPSLEAASIHNSSRDHPHRRKGRRRKQKQDSGRSPLHPHKPMPVLDTSMCCAKQSHSLPGSMCSLSSCSSRGFPVHVHPENQPFSPGVWYYSLLEADHILFVISRRRAGVHFDILYSSIFNRCRQVAPSLKRSQTSQGLLEGRENLSSAGGGAQGVQAKKVASSASLGSKLGSEALYDSSSAASSRSSFSSTCISLPNSDGVAKDSDSENESVEEEEADEAWMDVLERHSSWEQETEFEAAVKQSTEVTTRLPSSTRAAMSDNQLSMPLGQRQRESKFESLHEPWSHASTMGGSRQRKKQGRSSTREL